MVEIERRISGFEKIWITESELMIDLKISRSTMYRYKTFLGLPYAKIGGKTYFCLQDVNEFMMRNSTKVVGFRDNFKT